MPFQAGVNLGGSNSVMKDPEKVDIRFAMCFPDVYEIGMSHLGIQILYDMFNQREDVWCERVYSPWVDLDQIMRERKIPLFALESQDPVKQFDFLGITIQYEMCYTNILQVLELSQIPLFASERGETDPIVIGGGPCVYNPEPLADFFDLFYIGEGETVYGELLDAYKENRRHGGSRKDYLEKAAEIEGIYVPSFYVENDRHRCLHYRCARQLRDGNILPERFLHGLYKNLIRRRKTLQDMRLQQLQACFYKQPDHYLSLPCRTAQFCSTDYSRRPSGRMLLCRTVSGCTAGRLPKSEGWRKKSAQTRQNMPGHTGASR